jgi:hypothetical protein
MIKKTKTPLKIAVDRGLDYLAAARRQPVDAALRLAIRQLFEGPSSWIVVVGSSQTRRGSFSARVG